MKELVKNEFNLCDLIVDKIEKIEDKSDNKTKRLRITFKNKYGISIIKGYGTYSGNDSYEIAPLDKKGCLCGKLLKIDFDDVLG